MTTQEERQTAALANAVAWLEDELRDTRAGMAKLTQALEQSQAQVWELTNRLHRAEDTIAGMLPRLAGIPQFDGQVAQLKDVVSGMHEHGLATAARLNDLIRNVDATVERDRQVFNDLAHRLDAVERQAQGVGGRLDTLDEATRRTMEAITLLRQRADEIARSVETLETRLGRVTEAGTRVEHEQSRLAAELDGLHKQDDLIGERVQVYTELIKRLESQIAVVAQDVAVKQDVLEKIDLSRVEIHRVEERLSVTEAAADNLRDQLVEIERQVGLAEGKQKGFQDRLNGLLADVAAQRQQVNEQFQRLYQLQERLKRRQIEDLERELREMRIHAFRAAEEQ